MNKPYIVCHMMTSLDGRIDCGMTEQLTGVDKYYETLASFAAPVTVSGRVTAELEMAEPGKFQSDGLVPYGKAGFKKNADLVSYDVIMDTHGTLLWPDHAKVLVVTCENVSKQYLEYLDGRHISWIAAGKDRIDLVKVMDILAGEFGAERVAVVGGGTINGAFLKAGLLDEISILMGPGIDGRKGMGAVFDGRAMNTHPVDVRLNSVKAFEDGSLWIRYEA